MKKTIGYILNSLPFLLLFVYGVQEFGFAKATIGIILYGAIVGCIVGGVFLITREPGRNNI